MCLRVAAVLFLMSSLGGLVFAQSGLRGLTEVPLTSISDRTVTPLGTAALAIRPGEWKHAETANFVYHFFHSFIATPVSIEAEFYYRFIAKDLDRETAQWERKCHVFIFEKPEDWRTFQASAHLDPWTGGIHSRGELFIVRDPSFKFKGDSLAHETAHLVIDRFFGSGVPLWLNEGYAEYVGQRAYAIYYRARGYNARPRSSPMAPADVMPLSQLTGLVSYPADPKQVGDFYNQSERLVRFLAADGGAHFVTFVDALAKGNRIDSALWKAFGARFPSLEAIGREFTLYASKDHAPDSER